MNQIKIGKFIAECRKKNNLTQMQLAEKLNITDRAISKWENGKGMPDSSIMLDLCNELKISVNELLSGEVIEMKEYNEKTEKLLLEMAKKEELQNKKIVWLTAVASLFIIGFYVFVAIVLSMNFEDGNISETLFNCIMVLISILFIGSLFIINKPEVEAGYQVCKHCGERFVPTYKQAVMVPHMGYTRYLKCPNCGKKSWAKKVMSK